MWFWSFWWLIFPVMFFATGALQMWLRYKRHKDTLDLMKIYAAQGKDPAEIARILGVNAQAQPGAPPFAGGPSGATGPAADWGWPYGHWRGFYGGRGPWGRWGPYREWRRFTIFACLAVGFGLANRYSGYSGFDGADHAFSLVAIIMSVLAAGSLIMAVVSTVIAINTSKNGG